MIRNPSIVQSFELALTKENPPDYHRNLRIFEALYAEALSLGVIPLKDALDGIDTDIRVAGVVNAGRAVPSNSDSA
jgi:hypothetical protein